MTVLFKVEYTVLVEDLWRSAPIDNEVFYSGIPEVLRQTHI